MNKLILGICILICFVFISCRKNINEFYPGMTKQEVSDAWGKKAIKTFTTIDDKIFEIWRYDFRDGICYLIFNDNKLIATHIEPHKNLLSARDILFLKIINRK